MRATQEPHDMPITSKRSSWLSPSCEDRFFLHLMWPPGLFESWERPCRPQSSPAVVIRVRGSVLTLGMYRMLLFAR